MRKYFLPKSQSPVIITEVSYLSSFNKGSLSWHLAIICNIDRMTKEKIFEERVVLREILTSTISGQKSDTLPLPSTKQFYVHFSAISTNAKVTTGTYLLFHRD